jgi:putative transcriptional regulator
LFWPDFAGTWKPLFVASIANLETRTDGRARRRGAPYLLAIAIFVGFAALVPALSAAQKTKSANVTSFFLVAIPDLPDPMFQQTVILMLPPTQLPLVAGVVINKPTTIPLPKLFPRAPALRNPVNAYFGGPVEITEPSLVVRAAEPSGNVTRLFDDVYVSTDPGSIAKLLKDEPQPAKNLRVFFGRAQWTLDQLHAEILAGAWYVIPAKADLVFSSDPGRVWKLLVERAHLHEVADISAQVSNPRTLPYRKGQSPAAWPSYSIAPTGTR